jgi:hypothetical protein
VFKLGTDGENADDGESEFDCAKSLKRRELL